MPLNDRDLRGAPPSPASDRQVVLTALGLSVAMFIWMARPLLTGEVPFTGDLLHLHYPLRDFYARALAAGHRFDWMPSLFGGFYVVGEGELGAYHPLHWLVYRVLPLDAAFALEVIAPYPLLFAGTFVLLRSWCGPAGSAFGAMLFASCGFNLSHGVHPNLVSVVAHVPWLLRAIHMTVAPSNERQPPAGMAAIGLLTGSQLLLGHPQAVWFSVLIEATYVAMLAGTGARVFRGCSVGRLVAGKGVGVAIGAVQLLATVHALEHSTRPAAVSFATSFSLPPLHLLQLLHPYFFWGRVLRWNEAPGAGDEFAAYGGAVALLLAAWWAATYPALRARDLTTRGDRLALYAMLFAVLGLWLALGSHGRLYHLQTYLPIVAQFRVPARYVLFTQLAFAVIAAVAFSRIMQAHAGERALLSRALWAPWTVVAVSVASAAGLSVRGGDAGSPSGTWTLALVLGPAFSLAAAGLLTIAVRGARWALIGLVLLAGGDQMLYGLGGIIGWQDYLHREEALGYLDTGDVRPGEGRLMHGGFPNLYTLAGYRMLDGYVALAPSTSLDYRSPSALRLAEVRYVHREFQDVARLGDVQPLAGGWFRLADPLPRARLLTRVRVSSQPAADLESIDVSDTALVTRGLPVTGGAPGTATIVRDDPGRIQVRTTAGGPQLLVLSESFDDGWTAAIDGAPVQIERVNGDFIGCLVPEGMHDVTFEFRPSHLVAGRAVTLGGWILALTLAAGSRFDRTRPRVSRARDARR